MDCGKVTEAKTTKRLRCIDCDKLLDKLRSKRYNEINRQATQNWYSLSGEEQLAILNQITTEELRRH